MQAQVIPSASFSIWAYLCSVSVRALEIYEIGRRSLFSCLCHRTAPMPQDEASADNIVSRVASYLARISLELRVSLILLLCPRHLPMHRGSLTLVGHEEALFVLLDEERIRLIGLSFPGIDKVR